MILTIPNILTMARILLLPFIMLGLYLEFEIGPLATWICFLLYVVAAITDYFDGYLARKLNQISAFGTFLDPISDKIFVAALLVLLVGSGRLDGLWMIPVILILTREFLVSGLREFLGPHNVKLPVTNLAKWKTTIQMAALGLLILGPAMPYALELGQWSLLLAAVITLITGWDYMKAGLEVMKKMP
jgi:cardiolipin synthase